MWRRPESDCACGGRRRAVLALLIGLPSLAAAARAAAEEPARRWVRVYNTHTREELEAVFFDGSDYVPGQLGMLDWLLRDHRTGELVPMRRELFDLMYGLAVDAGVDPRYELVSGYRSPATNAMLAATTGGVSARSLHMEGLAVDVRLSGFPTARLRDLALAKQAGGVGFYPKSDFVHLDLGRVRSWSG